MRRMAWISYGTGKSPGGALGYADSMIGDADMRIGVIGAGHVGLVTGVALASLGNDVVAMDADDGKLRFLAAGKAPFFEPGLDELLARMTLQGKLRFTDRVDVAVEDAAVVFICVGRPPAGNGDRSLGAVEEAARAVARDASDGVTVV